MTEHQKEILYKKLYGEKIKEWKRDTVLPQLFISKDYTQSISFTMDSVKS